MERVRGPRFLRFCIPIIDVLNELGGSGKAAEITDAVIERLHISEKEQAELLKNGNSRVRNQIAWARFYLAKAGLIDSSRYGVWALTDKGRLRKFTASEIHKLFRDVRTKFSKKTEEAEPVEDESESGSPTNQLGDNISSPTLLEVLRSLSSDGFERVSQRLLREHGFERVVVTGQSRDGGIDGHGILQINPFVSFTVLFQCKKYAGAVSASHVRDFRGAMQGRADKGIIMTTGTFTTEAKREARRDGAPPIELVDGEQLVQMFERLELGVRPKTIYEVDEAFFEEYR
jgi:restriction system protein